jgi:hypothetical protein
MLVGTGGVSRAVVATALNAVNNDKGTSSNVIQRPHMIGHNSTENLIALGQESLAKQLNQGTKTP